MELRRPFKYHPHYRISASFGDDEAEVMANPVPIRGDRREGDRPQVWLENQRVALCTQALQGLSVIAGVLCTCE